MAADKSGMRPTAISVPRGPGSIEGLGEAFQVNLNSGSVTESVPLQLPQGTGGQQPQVALRYDSGQGNGPLGIGWSLGLPTIQLQTEKGLPRYDGNDSLLLQGAELVPVAADEWRLKNEGAFVRVRRSGAGFEVALPSGTIQRFGTTPDARVEFGAFVYAWALEDEIDVFGNRISYFYEKDGHLPWLMRIEYNRRPGAAANVVSFTWETRPDVLTDYRPTFRTTMARRLKSIRVESGGTLVRRYELSYQMGTGLSLLSAVTMYGEDDATAMPPLSFEWTPFSFTGARVASMTGAPATLPGGSPDVEFTDVDGDSFPDLLEASAGGHRYWRNRGGTAFDSPRQVSNAPNVALGTAGVELSDVDGDGRADLVARTGTTPSAFRYFPSTGEGGWGNSVVFSNNPSFPVEDGTTRFVDLDGDRRPDAFRLTANSVVWWRNDGSGSWASPEALPPLDGQTTLDFTDPRVKLADVNGDRVIDVAFVRSNSFTWWPSKGRGRFDSPQTVAGAPVLSAANELAIQLADLNGDGLADLLLNDTDHVDAWFQVPSGGFAMSTRIDGTPFANAALTHFRLGDIDANGSTDLIWLTPSAAGDQRVQYLDLQPGMRPNLLRGVRNGLGLAREFSYSSSAAQFQAALDAGMPWKTRVPFPVQVIASSTVSDSRGHSFSTRYDYRDGLYSGATREFRGFGQVTVTEEGDDDEPTSVVAHWFDLGEQVECLKGRERATETRGADGTLFWRVENELVPRIYAQGLNGVPVAGADVTERRTFTYEGQATPTLVVEGARYDDYGNQVLQRRDGVADAGGDESLVERTFINDPQRWILGRLAEEKVSELDGGVVRWKRAYYDGEPFVGLPLGQVTRGVPTREESWVSGTRWVQTSRVQRDEFGNVVATLTPGGARRDIAWDATHTRPVKETLHLTADRSLVVSASYGPTGLVSSFTDVNGAVTRFRYDALRRLTAILKPGDPDDAPTLSWNYLLSTPLSSVEHLTRDDDATTRSIEVFDGLGRSLAFVHQAEGGRWVIEGRREYSRRGSVVTEYDPFFSDVPDVMAEPPSAAVRHRYDATGRLRETRHVDGSRSEIRYLPLARELWDGEDLDPSSPHAGTPTLVRLDGLGRTASVTERLGERQLVTRFLYDAAGTPVATIDAKGHVAVTVVDGLGRVTDVIHPDAGHRRYIVDDDGNVQQAIDARGHSVGWTWDAAHRPLVERQLDATGAEVARVEYHYDEPSPRFPHASSSAGKLSWVKDAAGEEHFEYDERGRTISELRIADGIDYLLRQGFDRLDRVRTLTYPDGSALTYEYNERGLVSAIPGILVSAQYDARGKATRRELANGVVTTISYDDQERVRNVRATNRSGTVLQDLALTYDRAGTLRSVVDAVHPAGAKSSSWRYTYDDLYRLIRAEGSKTVSYDYDDVGNLTQKSDVGAYGYDDPSHPGAVTSVGGRPILSDANGNMVGGLGRTLTWNSGGQLVKVTTVQGTTEYTYDYTGRRALKKVGGATTVYLDKYAELRDGRLIKYVHAGDLRLARIGGSMPKVLEASAAALGPVQLGALLTAVALFALRRLGAARRLFALFLAVLLGGCQCGRGGVSDALYYLDSPVGTSSVLVDGDGEDVFDAWGAPLSLTDEPYGFAGVEYDVEAGLHHLGARMLDPHLGRFVSVDTSLLARPDVGVEDPQSLNLYSYARNTPTSLQDRSGQLPHVIVGALVGAAVGSVVYLAKAAYNGEQLDGRKFAAAAVGGAVAGAVGAATFGVGLVASGAISGAVGGIVERGIITGSAAAAFQPQAIITDAALGAVTGGLLKGGGIAASKVVGAVRNRLGAAATAVAEDLSHVCNGASCGGPGCFVAGTPVLLASGQSVPIETIREGDVVLAADESSGWQRQPRRVLEAYQRDVDVLVDILVESDGRHEFLTTTDEHPFLVEENGARRWRAAGALRAGATLVTTSATATVEKVAFRRQKTRVFNLNVDSLHTYVVGATHLVVHNAGCSPGAGRPVAAGGAAGGERAGKAFTRAGKTQVKAENAAAHGGQTTCTNCGQRTVPGQQSRAGVTPPGNETHVDHIIPRSKGGNGSPDNGQVLCRDCNLRKGAD
ncbi:MAG: toxin TcdB middle/N-terminal domain-containing protein [Myxococcota bacterium]